MEDLMIYKILFHQMNSVMIEVILKDEIPCSDEVKVECETFLKANRFRSGTVISSFPKSLGVLYANVEYIIVSDNSIKHALIDFSQPQQSFDWCFYRLDKNGQHIESQSDENGEIIELGKIRNLPCQEYYNLWENLHYDNNIKENLLKYAITSVLYADKNIDFNIVSYNRVVLLHGPPGTGKTSLCKALAQKLAIRLQHRFKSGILLEINSHSLFSKWFSESGKLVTKMFGRVTELVQNPNLIVFVLIDEIESLTHAREKSMSGVDPSDSIRVVNAVLTQIDQIRKYPNIVILTTSNMTQAIDVAFVDRADIKYFIDLPGPEAIYQIYYSCIEELRKGQIISPRFVIMPNFISEQEEISDCTSNCLYNISKLSVGFSGRILRKVPFLAHALYLKGIGFEINVFFDAMVKAIHNLQEEKRHFSALK